MKYFQPQKYTNQLTVTIVMGFILIALLIILLQVHFLKLRLYFLFLNFLFLLLFDLRYQDR